MHIQNRRRLSPSSRSLSLIDAEFSSWPDCIKPLFFSLVTLVVVVLVGLQVFARQSLGRIFIAWLMWIALIHFSIPFQSDSAYWLILLFGAIYFQHALISYPSTMDLIPDEYSEWSDFHGWAQLRTFLSKNGFVFIGATKWHIMPAATLHHQLYFRGDGVTLQLVKQVFKKIEYSISFVTYFSDGRSVRTTNLTSIQDIISRDRHPHYVVRTTSSEILLASHIALVEDHRQGASIVLDRAKMLYDLPKLTYEDIIAEMVGQGRLSHRSGRCKATAKWRMRFLWCCLDIRPYFEKTCLSR